MGSMANKLKKKVNGGKKKVKVAVNADEIDAYVKKRVLAEKESILKHEREKMIATVREWFLLESALVLHDDYGYGRKRLADYLRRHVMKVKAMEVEGCSYQEIEDALKDEIGFDFGAEMKAVAKEVDGEFTDGVIKMESVLETYMRDIASRIERAAKIGHDAGKEPRKG